MPYLSVSTWSLHRHLGPLRWTQWDADNQTHVTQETPQPQEVALLDLPQVLAKRGYKAVDICHFHFPSTGAEYLRQLRQAFADAGIRFHTLLLDYGDLSTADDVRAQADMQLAGQWIDIASQAGAERIRLIAGDDDPSDEAALERAGRRLSELAAYAEERGVRAITENFHSLASTAANCIRLVDRCEGKLGLLTDFGNFKGAGKYDQIAAILPYSDSVHAKPHYDGDGRPDADEFRRCLDQLPKTGFDGAIALIYDGPGDMWSGLDRAREVVEPYLT